MVDVPMLAPDELRRVCPLDALPGTPPEVVIGRLGQDRALEALAFGLGMRYPDYHLFAVGEPGLGKHTTVRGALEARARTEPAPPDACYVHDFADDRRRSLLRVPAGQGHALRSAVAHFLDDVGVAISAARARADERTRRAAIVQRLTSRRDAAFAAIRGDAAAKDIAIESTSAGVAMTPLQAGTPLTPEQFEALEPAARARIAEDIRGFEERIAAMLLEVPQWVREARELTRALDREIAERAVGESIAALQRSWSDHPEVLAWLTALGHDVVAHADALVAHDEPESGDDDELTAMPSTPQPRRRHRVDVVVEHRPELGAPVIYEDNPTYENLVGRIDVAGEGESLEAATVVAGALVRANGGYLVLDADRLLANPSSWPALVRALLARELRIESPAQALGLGRTITLEPQPIPLDLKCVLIGDVVHFELLSAADPEFDALFKVLVEFASDVDRTPATTAAFAGLVVALVREARLAPFEPAAVAGVIEQAARLAEDAERLSLRIGAIAELLREADHVARAAGATTVARADVDAALAARWRRSASVHDRWLAELRRGTFLVDTHGAAVGQVNALTVAEVAAMRFGRPNRVTARVKVGRGELVDIARETRMGGPIHSKGVLTLAGHLAGRYCPEGVLALSASLVFEQAYGPIEGDSASLAELCALVSALSELPVRQGIAVTGAIDQVGNVQAVGGVDEKIEGFFAACAALGLGGVQGVVIPRACARRLMLAPEVVAAVAAGRFAVWAVATVDEALAILLDVPAGERDAQGRFPPESIHGRVEARLRRFAEALGRSGGR